MGTQYENQADSRMKKTIDSLQKELSRVRTGRATPALVEGIRADCYGTPTPLNQIAAIAIPDPKTINISPWDKNLLAPVEKAILSSDLGLTPMRDKALIRLSIPPLTEERRKDLAKQCAKICEESKVAIRNLRRDINDSIKSAEKKKDLSEDDSKREQANVQKVTDKFVKQIDEINEKKQQEIMSV